MSNVIKFPEPVTTDSFFGGCPHCGNVDSCLNLGRDHWFYCAKHKTKWCIGSNLFSSWKWETEADWKRNEYKLAEYVEVMPVCPEPTEEELRQRAELEKLMQQMKEMDKGHGVKWVDGVMRAVEKDE